MSMPRLTARRALLSAVGIGVLVDIAVPGNAPGVQGVLLMATFLAAAALVAGREGIARSDPADAWIPAAALVFAALPAIRADDWLVAADVMLAGALALGTIACLAGARITRGLVPAILSASVGLMVAPVVGAATVLRALRRPARTVEDGAPAPTTSAGIRARLAPAAPVARGLLIAIPVLILFAALFASADAVFAELARTVLDWQIDLDLGRAAERTLTVTAVAWAVAGLLAVAAGALLDLVPGHWDRTGGGPAAPTGWILPADAATGPRDTAGGPPAPPWSGSGRSLGAASVTELTHGPRLGTVEAATVLVLVGALFAVFVGLQLAYLFGGRDTMAVAGLTYAEYARRGFFELVTVAVLAGMLVVTLDLAVGERSRVQLGASLVVIALTGIVLVSALLRLRLYQDMYGWTELRFVVAAAIGWLAVALGAAAVLLATRTTRWTLHVLGVLTLVTVAAMNVVGPQAFVAERNLERAIDPSLVPAGGRTGLDAGYLASLGDEAVPAVVAAYPRLPPGDRAQMDVFLSDRANALATDPALRGWPSWNLARARARDALAGWLDAH